MCCEQEILGLQLDMVNILFPVVQTRKHKGVHIFGRIKEETILPSCFDELSCNVFSCLINPI